MGDLLLSSADVQLRDDKCSRLSHTSQRGLASALFQRYGIDRKQLAQLNFVVDELIAGATSRLPLTSPETQLQ
jgi:hypothetical protein